MRKASFLLALFFAMPLAGSWWPSWSPTEIRLLAGQTADITVQAQWSGLTGYNDPIDWSFRSDNGNVAVAAFHLIDHERHTVRVAAVGPGTAFIRTESQGGMSAQYWVVIHVGCDAEPPVHAATPVVQARLGQVITLKAFSEFGYRAQFAWFLGREGDRSRPLAAGGPELDLRMGESGSQYVWVSATTPCSTSSAEFRVDVSLPRRRAAR